jgi:hypothetical protein
VWQLKDEFQQREHYFRQSIDESFSQMNERHIQLLTELELISESERVRSAKRFTANVSSLERISIYLADRQEFDQAIAISREAKATQESEASDRIQLLELRCQTLTRQLFAKFEKEFALLEDRLANGLGALRGELAQEIRNHRRQCSVAVRRRIRSVESMKRSEKSAGRRRDHV